MKALLYYGNKDIRLEEIEKPEPKSNEVSPSPTETSTVVSSHSNGQSPNSAEPSYPANKVNSTKENKFSESFKFPKNKV